VNEKKRTGQDRKKATKGLYFTYLWSGEAPTEAMYMKICVVGDVLDAITYVPRFKMKFFRGYDFSGGSNFPFFY